MAMEHGFHVEFNPRITGNNHNIFGNSDISGRMY
jgi:hypothetical protein